MVDTRLWKLRDAQGSLVLCFVCNKSMAFYFRERKLQQGAVMNTSVWCE